MAITNDKKTHDPVHKEIDRNPDPITGAPGSHPVGTGIGSASGAATGAALGALGGPIGAVIGAIAGGITGGLVGHEIGEAVDPTEEEAYWRENYADRPYTEEGEPYESYQNAYALGYHTAGVRDESFDEAEPHLREAYEKHLRQIGEGKQGVEYDRARQAIRDAYERVQSRKS